MLSFEIPTTWDRTGLEAAGFEGFIPLLGVDTQLLPPRPGIYVVLRSASRHPEFVANNAVTSRPAYPIERLTTKWLGDQTIVYIGKADPVNGIRARVGAFGRQAENHSGGRALWQLTDAQELLVAWLETPNHPSALLESHYLDRFINEVGQLPFANWRR